MTTPRRTCLALGLTLACSTIGLACGSGDGSSDAAPTGPPQQLRVEVVATHPHDPRAYTQGLEVAGDDRYVESTGLYGKSTVREVALDTGTVVNERDLPAEDFAEGLTRVGDRIVQITWKEGVAYVYEADDLTQVGTFEYQGEGWGICFDGDRLVMSDGSATLTFRDASTFEVEGQVEVTEDGRAVDELNELECVDGSVYANVYQTDRIVQIHADSGRVIASIDASGLLTAEQANHAEVLNGIAYDHDREVFLLTGKLWPSLFEVTFEPVG